MLNIGIIGCGGRMGQVLIRTIASSAGCTISGGTERKNSPLLGKDLGSIAGIEPLNITAGEDAGALVVASDAIIDFTSPEATLSLLEHTAKAGKVHIIGTTGFNAAQEKSLRALATSARVIWSGNMSFGVNLLASLVEKAASVLDDAFDIEIVEMHHKHKVDAPSGTAILLGEAAAKGRGKPLADLRTAAREGQTGERKTGSIGFAALRGGDVVGDHTVIFAGMGERFELTHKSSSREIYARGAVKAALWAQAQKPGLYSMKDVLGL